MAGKVEGVYEMENPEAAYEKTGIPSPRVFVDGILGNRDRMLAEAIEPIDFHTSYDGTITQQEKWNTDYNLHKDNFGSVWYSLFSGPLGFFKGLVCDAEENIYARAIYSEVMARAEAAGKMTFDYKSGLAAAEKAGKDSEKAKAKEAEQIKNVEKLADAMAECGDAIEAIKLYSSIDKPDKVALLVPAAKREKMRNNEYITKASIAESQNEHLMERIGSMIAVLAAKGVVVV